MNAKFGLVILKVDRMRFLKMLPPKTVRWGDEIYEVDSPSRYVSPIVMGVEFGVHPVTKFILNRLPEIIRSEELEFVSIDGPLIDKYQRWCSDGAEGVENFEIEFIDFLSRVNFWAVMFAPEGERLEDVVYLNFDELIPLLRKNVGDIPMSDGFLAIKS
ncbi:hypothetical protein [Burkholderia gladioli]|uniref:Uncharacterized protein n=1 Tax=Burkholderia gladioli TaxID=28095 RepID=A0A2A7RZY1_BURGA|nr:hypothetical protein [Burkholderia gladioli]MBA1362078.1 hypothetical protein [Burkholderia gladioli]MBU9426663.1 hypothetical protein [Burkholderia gladioli]MDN8063370.1 hypothetical protein [Burkholderia gladioli]PEH36793.1 hypothetical protein CRM94_19495 [Burkholderia gladioli]QPQ83176.1 hypothetical protein I6H08_18210 [Burkholderia gladioli]